MSDNITVRSIVGRFLDHSRVWHFGAAGADEDVAGACESSSMLGLASRNGDALVVFEYFDWIERAGLSVWIREESLWAFPIILILHTIGLAFLVGANVALDVRVLGVARGVPLPAMLPFFRAMWLGFWVNAASGVLLLVAYPTKALTNPVFYVKLALVAIGLAHARWIRAQILANPAFGETPSPANVRMLSAAALVCWLAAVTAGRLLAYTHTYLLAFEGRY